MARISKELHDIIKKAHMAGQFSAGVDPSYSEALAYCENITIDSGADAQKEIDELKAIVNELRDGLFAAKAHIRTESEYRDARELYEKTPAQSLNHIKARVKEDTIWEVAEYIRPQRNDIPATGEEFYSAVIQLATRKCKEQSDE